MSVLGTWVEPVQLQVACRQLWSLLPRDANQITQADVVALGNVDQGLASYYAAHVRTAASRTGVPERAIRAWFDEQLITPQGMRGQVLEGPEGTGESGHRLLTELLDGHLVQADKRRQATWYELAHDRLIEPIRQDNAAWRSRHLSSFARAAELWHQMGRPGQLLLIGADLAAAEHDGQPSEALTANERDFLEASRRAARSDRGLIRRLFRPPSIELQEQLRSKEAQLRAQASLLEVQEDKLREQANRLRELAEFDQRSATAGGVFISYSHDDKDVVDAIVSRFRGDEVNYWRDEKDLLVGDVIEKAISEGIQRFNLFLVVLTPKSIHSKWVERELDEAAFEQAEGRKVILPVLAKDLRPTVIPPRLRRIRYVDLSPSFDHGYAQLISSIRGHLKRQLQAGAP